ncbi:hypothetical protein CEXT_115831 [Caerostris extrusa]|uniref:Uncharacterized protein n=1 Tax=Caerostris extrusa TaxID=172846 RepID=A0AAV4T9M1_CAEEX|nr:hypothetical protein CEXT_115831 [Caerostris extrusa]
MIQPEKNRNGTSPKKLCTDVTDPNKSWFAPKDSKYHNTYVLKTPLISPMAITCNMKSEIFGFSKSDPTSLKILLWAFGNLRLSFRSTNTSKL